MGQGEIDFLPLAEVAYAPVAFLGPGPEYDDDYPADWITIATFVDSTEGVVLDTKTAECYYLKVMDGPRRARRLGTIEEFFDWAIQKYCKTLKPIPPLKAPPIKKFKATAGPLTGVLTCNGFVTWPGCSILAVTADAQRILFCDSTSSGGLHLLDLVSAKVTWSVRALGHCSASWFSADGSAVWSVWYHKKASRGLIQKNPLDGSEPLVLPFTQYSDFLGATADGRLGLFAHYAAGKGEFHLLPLELPCVPRPVHCEPEAASFSPKLLFPDGTAWGAIIGQSGVFLDIFTGRIKWVLPPELAVLQPVLSRDGTVFSVLTREKVLFRFRSTNGQLIDRTPVDFAYDSTGQYWPFHENIGDHGFIVGNSRCISQPQRRCFRHDTKELVWEATLDAHDCVPTRDGQYLVTLKYFPNSRKQTQIQVWKLPPL
jgi:hypothetical protein